MELLHHRNEVI